MSSGTPFARDDAVDDPVQPAHALAARRALAARLVVVEAQHHLQQPHHAGALGDHDHAAGAQRRAGRCELLVVEASAASISSPVSTLVEMPPGMMALSVAPAGHAAAVLVDELARRGSRSRSRRRRAG